jgi:segregation and condensation protein B
MPMFDNETEEQQNLMEETTAETSAEEAGAEGPEIPLELQSVEAPAEEQVFVDSLQLFSILESLFFASDKAVSFATLKVVFQNTNIDNKMLKRAIEELQSIYADPTRGVTLEEVTGGWQLRTKLDNMDFLKKISKARPFRLSGPALEVLSIIAYKQPIIKNEVDQIRGVESGHLVRALMEKGLVSFEGKTDLPGKPMAYSTTRKFLEIFGLRNLQELPSLSEIDQLLPEGIGEEEEKETLSDVTSNMSTSFTATSYSEGEEELGLITERLNSIDTSSEFFEQEKVRQKEKREREKAEDIREAMAVGELVENKDVKWLERYEAQMALKQQAAEAAQLAATVEVANVEATDVVAVDASTLDSTVEAQNESSSETEELAAQDESSNDY